MRHPTISVRAQDPSKPEEPPNPVDPELTAELSEVPLLVLIHYSVRSHPLLGAQTL